jgi:hypothetical protein
MTPDLAKAIDIYNRLSMGALQYNFPQAIPGAPIPQKATATPAGPMPPANSVNYGYAPSPNPPTPTAWSVPPVAAPVMPDPAVTPGMNPYVEMRPPAPAPLQPPMPGIPAPPASPPAAPVAATPPPFDFAAFQAQQAQAALAAAGLQPTPVSPFPGASPAQVPALQAQGWTPETWAQVAGNPQHVAQVLASLGV